jgi:hypothetical protein
MDTGGNSRIMARRHAPEQVIAKVRQGQKMVNDGRPMVEVIKELQVTEATKEPLRLGSGMAHALRHALDLMTPVKPAVL